MNVPPEQLIMLSAVAIFLLFKSFNFGLYFFYNFVRLTTILHITASAFRTYEVTTKANYDIGGTSGCRDSTERDTSQ